jgi:serine/threonine-protein kinase
LLKARQRLGKYRILGRIATGPLANVYRAQDTIQKIKVALKIPKADDATGHEEFLHEVQVATKLKHPNILTVMNASYIDDQFVIAMELGDESLADRIERRISTARALDLAGQALASMAHAHAHKIIHCDIKPENFILFPDNQLKLADFGFAKLNLRTLKASGSGTIDYIAPEQAMGRPKFQSDVFSLGLVIYRLLSGSEFGRSSLKCFGRLFSWIPSSVIAMQYKCRRLLAKHKAMCENKSVPSCPPASAMQKWVRHGDACNGASFNVNLKSHCKLPTAVVNARVRLLRACTVVPGVDSIIPLAAPILRCHQVARAANAESRMTGIIVPGVTDPGSSRKPVASIPTNATRQSANGSAAMVR